MIQRKTALERISPTLVHVYNCTKNNSIDFSSYYLMYGWKPRHPIDIRFGLTLPQAEGHSCNKFFAKHSAWLSWCYELANLHQCKESTCHVWWYDWKMRAPRLEPGNICLVRQKVFGSKHKNRDHWILKEKGWPIWHSLFATNSPDDWHIGPIFNFWSLAGRALQWKTSICDRTRGKMCLNSITL